MQTLNIHPGLVGKERYLSLAYRLKLLDSLVGIHTWVWVSYSDVCVIRSRNLVIRVSHVITYRDGKRTLLLCSGEILEENSFKDNTRNVRCSLLGLLMLCWIG